MHGFQRNSRPKDTIEFRKDYKPSLKNVTIKDEKKRKKLKNVKLKRIFLHDICV